MTALSSVQHAPSSRWLLWLFAGLLLLLGTEQALPQETFLGELSDDDRAHIANTCLPLQQSEGATAYRDCIARERDLIVARETGNTVAPVAADNAPNATSADTLPSQTPELEVQDAPEIGAANSATDTTLTDAAAQTSTTADVDTESGDIAQSENQDTSSPNDSPLQQFLSSFTASMEGLDTTSKALLYAALPLTLLLILWGLMRGRQRAAPAGDSLASRLNHYDEMENNLDLDIGNDAPNPHVARMHQQAEALFDDEPDFAEHPTTDAPALAEDDTFAVSADSTARHDDTSADEYDRTFAEPIGVQRPHFLEEADYFDKLDREEANASATTQAASDLADAPDDTTDAQTPRDAADTVSAGTASTSAPEATADKIANDVEAASQTPSFVFKQSDFGLWLAGRDSSERLSWAIEFLIYWVAYADKRYLPALRDRLFSSTELDEHDQIKRWVLQHDNKALADTLAWFQAEATMPQRRQTVELLMALLVADKSLTPNQNTLLRFFSDVFGLGRDWLEQRYFELYELPMPSLPRTDKPRWWQQQSAERLLRWDARALADANDELTHRARLGLDLDGEIPVEVLEAVTIRSLARCRVENFSSLTAAERDLVAAQAERYRSSYAHLSEVLA